MPHVLSHLWALFSHTVQVFSCIEDGWWEYTGKLLAVRAVRVQPSINHNAGGGCNN